MRATKVLVFAASVLFLWSCAEKQDGRRAAAPEQARSDKGKPAGQTDASIAISGEQQGQESGIHAYSGSDAITYQPQSLPSTDHKIIRNATLVIETDDPADSQRAVGAIAESNGGFVVTSDFKTSGSLQSGVTVNVILRVPGAVFETTLAQVRRAGAKVLEENVSGKDVTEEYIDLEARLRTKKALEAQFLEIMKQARKVSDALEVQSNIASVRTEIEQIEGRRKYLDNQSSLATISVTFRTPAPMVTATATGFGHSIKEAFGDGADLAVAIVLGLIRIVIVMIPIAVLILLPIGWTGRYLVRRYLRTKPAQPAAQA
ncbi:MAG TPA: DUF4349 domain-containing protein [Blastocatellia bacterium]|nr:DUF4349 domain-containing protein [Blastocatellia bacterium]